MIIVSPTGGVLLLGWVDDANDPIADVRLTGAGWTLHLPAAGVGRVRRTDLADHGYAGSAAVGYVALGYGASAIDCDGTVEVAITLASGAQLDTALAPTVADDERLRDVALAYIGRAHQAGEVGIRAGGYLDGGMGERIGALNRAIVGRLAVPIYVERFGPTPDQLVGSIVICLYGRPEYLFLQSALFSDQPGIDDYEFIYVLNSPELAETILCEARLAAMIYRLPISVAVMAGNAGFADANNAASQVARSGRLLFVNPDVFPKDPPWALRHSAVLLSRPTSETVLFGAALYYDNGSLMHAGMWLDQDRGVAFGGAEPSHWSLLRVEHHGKGAPADDTALVLSRPVTAVSGAFMSVEREWFETLDGFSNDYILGHYEDADLCLRSLEAGVAPWLHDLRLWHLEGGGSSRREAHAGAAAVNRWRFSTRWGDAVRDGGLLGRRPAHPLLADEQ